MIVQTDARKLEVGAVCDNTGCTDLCGEQRVPGNRHSYRDNKDIIRISKKCLNQDFQDYRITRIKKFVSRLAY
jgi:hypothetical protein